MRSVAISIQCCGISNFEEPFFAHLSVVKRIYLQITLHYQPVPSKFTFRAKSGLPELQKLLNSSPEHRSLPIRNQTEKIKSESHKPLDPSMWKEMGSQYRLDYTRMINFRFPCWKKDKPMILLFEETCKSLNWTIKLWSALKFLLST